LLQDRLAASISSHPQEENQRSVLSQQGDGAGDTNMNSILAIADDLGHVRCFLDGTYPLGAISLSPETSTPTLFKHPKKPVFMAHCQRLIDNTVATDLHPTVIELPLLRTRKPRDLAKLSSTTRELIWYTIRVVKEMRVVWFGSDTSSGARELGPKWIQALETKQKDQFGRECNNRRSLVLSADFCTFPITAEEDPNGMLDLTSLLVTGRVSDCLADFLGSGEQMSERVTFHLPLWNLI
jgi:anaphase-promoting complex subunit 4